MGADFGVVGGLISGATMARFGLLSSVGAAALTAAGGMDAVAGDGVVGVGDAILLPGEDGGKFGPAIAKCSIPLKTC
jgi:hypothetical protein